MKITAIKTFMGLFSGRNRGLIKVETDEGIYGGGEAYSIGPDLSIEPIADYIFEMIKGEDPRRIEYIMLKLTQQFRFPPGGVGLAVSSAVDHALWDISGKAAGLPVYMLLGGSCRERVREAWQRCRRVVRAAHGGALLAARFGAHHAGQRAARDVPREHAQRLPVRNTNHGGRYKIVDTS